MREGRRTGRWFRFSLAALLSLVALAACGVHFANTVRLVRLRQQAHLHYPVRARYLDVGDDARPPWLWRLLGAEPLSVVSLDEEAKDGDVAAVQQLFPEARVVVLRDPPLSDDKTGK